MSESAPSAPGGPAAGLQRFFDLAGHGTTLRTEVLAGITTFLTMAYILFVQPAVLSADFAGRPTGLDAGAVLLATALVAGLSSIFMGLYARYPIALAPGMGENFFFVTVIMALAARGVPDAWQTALGIVFLAGVVFLVLTLLRVREAIIHAVSPSLRNGIATGIGLFIAFIGLKNGGLIVGHPGTFVTLNTAFTRPNMAVFLLGLVVAGTLQARAVRGAILWGIAAATGLAALLGQVHYRGVVGLPVIADSAVLRMDLAGALRLACVPYIVVFVYMDLFDTVGTLVGVAEQADLMRGGRLPRAGRALLVDATGTVARGWSASSPACCSWRRWSSAP